MKKQNTIKSMLVALMLFTIGTLSAQTFYGGSAYAYVKDSEGNERCITVAIGSENYNEATAKEVLLSTINATKYTSEKLSSSVSFSTNPCPYHSKQYYSGSASVKVRNKKGEVRFISVAISCENYNQATAKEVLLSTINATKYTSEQTITPVEFDIDPCE